jgi:O-antigen/teichoic acid export membrane protein
MGSASRVLKNTLFLAASNLATKVLGAFFVIVLARYLEDYGFGQYSFAFSFAAVFVIFSDFGLDALTIKAVARNRELAGDFLELVGVLRLGLSLLMVAVSIIAGYLIGLEEHLLLIILVAGVSYIFDKLSGLFYALFRAYERMELEAGIQVVWKLVQVGVGLGAIHMGFTLLDIVLLLLVVSVIRCIIGFSTLIYMGIRPNRRFMRPRQIVKESVPFAAYEIGNAVYFNLIIITLFLLTSEAETGWYTAAFRVFMFLILIPAAFETAIYPLFARLYDTSPQEMRFAYGKSMKYTLVIALPVALVLWIFSGDFAGLFGSGFVNTGESLAIIAFALPFFVLNMLMKTALWSADAQKRMAVNIWISAIILGIVAFLLVTEEGFLGAALALVIGEIALFVLNLQALGGRGFGAGGHLWKVAGAGAAMFGLAYMLTEFLADRFPPYHAVFLSLVVYLLIIAASSTFTKNDRHIIASALRPRKPQ